jgi:hypothetical protein
MEFLRQKTDRLSIGNEYLTLQTLRDEKDHFCYTAEGFAEERCNIRIEYKHL